MILYDVAIIGGGPCGLFAAFQAKMLGLQPVIIDSQNIVGGQCTLLYPEKPIYDIPAHPSISGRSLVDNLLLQLAPFDIDIKLSCLAIDIIEIKNIEREEIKKIGEINKINKINKIDDKITGNKLKEDKGGGSCDFLKIICRNIATSDSNEDMHAVLANDINTNKLIHKEIGNCNGIDSTVELMEFAAKSVIIATGGGSFAPNRPPIDGIEEFENKSVFYSVQNKENFRGKILVIAGGGDSAMDWAVELSGIAKHIYFVHRRRKFRGANATAETLLKIAESNPESLTMMMPYQLKDIRGANGMLSSVLLVDEDGQEEEIFADVLLPFFGFSSDSKDINRWRAELAQHHENCDAIDVNPSTMESSRSNIFAIGDICHYPGKLKLILSGFSEGAIAIHAIKSRISNAPFHLEHSTSMFAKITKTG